MANRYSIIPEAPPETPEIVTHYPCPLCHVWGLTFLVELEYEDSSEYYYTPSYWYPYAVFDSQECDCILSNDQLADMEAELTEGPLAEPPGWMGVDPESLDKKLNYRDWWMSHWPEEVPWN